MATARYRRHVNQSISELGLDKYRRILWQFDRYWRTAVKRDQPFLADDYVRRRDAYWERIQQLLNCTISREYFIDWTAQHAQSAPYPNVFYLRDPNELNACLIYMLRPDNVTGDLVDDVVKAVVRANKLRAFSVAYGEPSVDIAYGLLVCSDGSYTVTLHARPPVYTTKIGAWLSAFKAPQPDDEWNLYTLWSDDTLRRFLALLVGGTTDQTLTEPEGEQ